MKNCHLLLSGFIVIIASTVYLYSYSNLTPAGLSESSLLGNVETALEEPLPELDEDGKKFIDMLKTRQYRERDFPKEELIFLSNIRDRAFKDDHVAIATILQAAKIENLPRQLQRLLKMAIEGIVGTQKMIHAGSIHGLEALVLSETNPEHLEKYIYRMLGMSN